VLNAIRFSGLALVSDARDDALGAREEAGMCRYAVKSMVWPWTIALIGGMLVNACAADPAVRDASGGAAGRAAGGSMDSVAGASNGGSSEVVPGADDLPTDGAHPYVRYAGRWNDADPKAPVARWGAVAIEARFEGTSLIARLTDGQLTVPGGVGTGNVYQFSIDGGAFQELASTAASEYPLATHLPDGAHDVMLVRRTESKFGTTTFSGFTLDPGKHLLVPKAVPTRSIEIFGDSISAGLADENRGDYTNVNENGYEAFGPKLARAFGAQWHVEARGGGSFFTTYLPMVPWFDRLYGPLDMQQAPDASVPAWDFHTWQPDVFVLALGTNDSSETYPATDQTAYVNKYAQFLTTLRGWYPNAEIFALAPFKEGAPWDNVRKYIPLAVTQVNDPKVHAIVPLQGTAPNYSGAWLSHPEDYVSGDDYHPNLSGHQKIADRLAEIIGPIVGW
jgi:lysophospholipase L1-like esterase